MVGVTGAEWRPLRTPGSQRLTGAEQNRILRPARPLFGAVSQHLTWRPFHFPAVGDLAEPGPAARTSTRLASQQQEHREMNDASRTQGWAICIGVAVLALAFAIGLLQQSYWALALPMAVLVFFVLGLAGWVGFTIATIQVDAENTAEITPESSDGETSS